MALFKFEVNNGQVEVLAGGRRITFDQIVDDSFLCTHSLVFDRDAGIVTVERVPIKRSGFFQVCGSPIPELNEMTWEFEDPFEKKMESIIKKNASAINYWWNAPESLQLLAFRKDPDSFWKIRGQICVSVIRKFLETETNLLERVDGHWCLVRYSDPECKHVDMFRHLQTVDNQDEFDKLLIELDSDLFRGMKNPSESNIELALPKDGLLLECVKSPTDVQQFIAVRQNATAIKFVYNPPEKPPAIRRPRKAYNHPLYRQPDGKSPAPGHPKKSGLPQSDSVQTQARRRYL